MYFNEFNLFSMEVNDMTKPHCHDFYEIYFLCKGERIILVNDKIFNVKPNSVVVIPPFYMHKTSGSAYTRINLNVSENLLTKEQNEILMKLYNRNPIHIEKQYADTIIALLKEGTEIQSLPIMDKQKFLLALTHTIILLLYRQNLQSPKPTSINNRYNIPTETLKLIIYLNENYMNHDLSIENLCSVFFVSKATLCNNFKKAMNCTIMTYVKNLKLSLAKKLLTTTNKSIEDIASECGFISANYFGLIFKKELGRSPKNYKKVALDKPRNLDR